MGSMLVRFLEQNGGTLSKRAREKEFSELKEDEVEKIESAIFEETKISQSKSIVKKITKCVQGCYKY